MELVSLPSAASWGLADGVDGRPGVSHQSACGGAGAAPQGLHREPAGPSFAGSILLLPHFPNYRCSLLIFAGPGADLQTGVNPSLGPFSCSEGTGPRSASAVYVCVFGGWGGRALLPAFAGLVLAVPELRATKFTKENTGCPGKFEFQIKMQYLGHTYAKKSFIIYLKFKFPWASCA